jgi:hypothetical protein
MIYVRVYLVIFGISILTAFGVYVWVPPYRSYLFHEDSLIENLSAILYLISFFTAFLFSLKIKIYRKALIVLSAVSLLGFLDELSFGERHTFASHVIMRGGSLKPAQELLAHKTMTMTLRYSHLSQEHKRKAVNLLNGLTRPQKSAMSQNVTNSCPAKIASG